MTVCVNPRHRANIRRFFEGRGSPRTDREMREHLETCSACRAYYERHLVLAEADPAAPSAQDRIGRGLGLPPLRRPLPKATLSAAVLGAAALAALFILPRGQGGTGTPAGSASTETGSAAAQRGSASEDEFRVRGAHPGASANPGASAAVNAGPSLRVFRVGAGKSSEPLGATMRPGDELGFAYVNPSGATHLLVFGVDEHQHVYWYHPAWEDARETPRALAIEPGASGERELPEAVRHGIDGRQLTLYGVFASSALSVREVEKRLESSGGARDPFAALGPVWQKTVRVENR